MEAVMVAACLTTAAMLMSLALLLKVPAGAWQRRMALATTWLVGLHLAVRLVSGLGLLLATTPARIVLSLPGSGTVAIRLDGISWLLESLVALVGLAVCRFGYRYLAGDIRQAYFYRWAAFTLGAVSLMLLADHFGLLVIAWGLSSLGMHRLLCYHNHRPAAVAAAWSKFAISRIGDLCLVVAAVIATRLFGGLDLALWTERLSEVAANGDGRLVIVAWLIVAGAMIKTVQIPFHSWLPETLEVPTPVSALMHAGIVNAGGYLLIRMAPLLSTVPSSLWLCTAVGGLTALYGVTVMRCQSSVKGALAYSTIAQMGFMVFECGLGAYSAALVHLVAHSLYKAHAFLASGELTSLRVRGESMRTERPTGSGVPSFAGWRAGFQPLLTAAMPVAVWMGLCATWGLAPTDKPGGLVLAFVLCAAGCSFVWQAKPEGLAGQLTRLGIVSLMFMAYLARMVFP